MEPPLRIREAGEADVPAIMELFAVLDGMHAAAAPDQFLPPTGGRSHRYVHDLMKDPSALVLVAERVSDIVGHVVARIETIPERPPLRMRRYAHVHDLAVAPDARRQGIGQRLVREVERWATSRGLDSVELTVWEFNDGARRLYDRLGYETQFRRLRRVLPE